MCVMCTYIRTYVHTSLCLPVQHVMRFAEVTQEVQIQVEKQPAKLTVGLTPGRRRANMLYKAAVKNGKQDGNENGGPQPPPVHPYHLALPLLCVNKVHTCLYDIHTYMCGSNYTHSTCCLYIRICVLHVQWNQQTYSQQISLCNKMYACYNNYSALHECHNTHIRTYVSYVCVMTLHIVSYYCDRKFVRPFQCLWSLLSLFIHHTVPRS